MAPSRPLHLFTLSKVHSVMSFCLHLEVGHRWVFVYDVKRENYPRRFRGGHAPSVLGLLNLIISTGLFNYFHSDPGTAFANILDQVLDPRTQATNSSTFLWQWNRRINFGLYAITKSYQPSAQDSRGLISMLSHFFHLDSATGTICIVRFQSGASQIEKYWESFSCTPGLPMHTAAGLFDPHGLWIMC